MKLNEECASKISAYSPQEGGVISIFFFVYTAIECKIKVFLSQCEILFVLLEYHHSVGF